MCGCPGCCQARVLEGGDGCTVLGMPPNCTLEDGYDGEFMLCILPRKTKDKKTKKTQKARIKQAGPPHKPQDLTFPPGLSRFPVGVARGWGTGWGGGVVLGVQPLSPPPGRKAPWGPRLPPARGRRPQSPRKKGQAPRSRGPREPRAGLGRGHWPPPLGRAPPAAPAIRGVMIASLTRSSRL